MAEKELKKIVGNRNVIYSPAILKEYSRDVSFAPQVMPRFVVKPSNPEEVRGVVKWANETLTPLVPVSSGFPHFRGDTVPTVAGAAAVDLSGMKKILRIDRRNRVAMVEPGVTFAELQPDLEKEGLRINMPFLPRKSKSVVSSMLEREPVIMPLSQWDAMDPMLCIEVIFGSGEMFRTGSAAGLGHSVEDQWQMGQAQVNPMGPGQLDLARVVQGSQGTMGIVSWATIKCELLPKLEKPFLLGSDNFEKIMEFIYKMMWRRLGNIWLILNNSNLAFILAKEPQKYNSIKNALPPWVLFFSLAGYEYFPQEQVEYQENDSVKVARRIGIELSSAISGVSAYELLKLLGQPSAEPYWKLRYKGSCQDIFFITTLDRIQKFIKVMYDIAKRHGYPYSNIGIYIQPMVQGTSCHCEFNLFYDSTDVSEMERVHELYISASQALMDTGAFFSRPYGKLAALVYQKDKETAAALRKVKSIFDPSNIMNPGKLCFSKKPEGR